MLLKCSASLGEGILVNYCGETGTKPWGYAIQHIPVPVPSWDNWEGCIRKGIWCKNGGIDGGGLLISPDGLAPTRIVGVSAFCYPP